jgi:hypothetical protein
MGVPIAVTSLRRIRGAVTRAEATPNWAYCDGLQSAALRPNSD